MQEEAFKKYVNETLPFYLSKFEQLISVNNNGGDGYIVGKEVIHFIFIINDYVII